MYLFMYVGGYHASPHVCVWGGAIHQCVYHAFLYVCRSEDPVYLCVCVHVCWWVGESFLRESKMSDTR